MDLIKLEFPLEAFAVLDRIAERHKIKNVEWAKASGYPPPRLSELRSMARKAKKYDRKLGPEKLNRLIEGLTKVLGGEIVRKDLGEELKNAEDPVYRVLLQMLVLLADRDHAREDIEALEMFLQRINRNRY